MLIVSVPLRGIGSEKRGKGGIEQATRYAFIVSVPLRGIGSEKPGVHLQLKTLVLTTLFPSPCGE